jgi:outer membrane protein TolC
MNLPRFAARAPTRGRLLFSLVAAAVFAGCAPPTPRIDGVPGAPAAPSTPWRVPERARTPPPPAEPPHAPQIDSALHADSSRIASVTALSMTDVIDLALRNNPATRESWATARAAVDQYGAARGALLPTVNGSVNLNRTSSTATSSFNGTGTNAGTGNTTGGLDSNATRGSGGGGTSGTRTQLTPAVSFSYLVFDFGGRAGTIESARQQAIANDLAHNLTIQNVVLQAEATLFSYLATRALRDAQVVAVREAQTDTAAAEARLRVGVGTLEEVLQTRTALAQARLQLATLEGNLVAARANLAASIGFAANARFDIPDIVTTDSVASIAASVDTLINRAIVERPDLAQARAQAAALAAQIRVARSAGYPALTISSTVSMPRQIGGTTNVSSGRTFTIVLGLQIPIFNGFSREYDVRSAREQYEAGLARVRSASQQITVQVFTSYAALQTATARVTAAVELLAAAQQSSDVAIGRYREGVGTIVDVLLARSALASARASAIQARWEWRTALAQLAHDVGVLDTTGRPNIPLNP